MSNDRLSGIPGSSQIGKGNDVDPSLIDADLAAAAMAKELVKQLGRPSIISKKFAVRKGVFKALNHTKEHKTGYDCSLRIMVYDEVENASVNIDAKYFERAWAYLMRPKFIVTGMPQTPNTFDEQEPTWGRKLLNMFTGKGNENKTGEKV